MSELRQNIATKEWVIIAPERSNRPEDFIRPRETGGTPVRHSESCPFCPGNEHLSPDEQCVLRDAEGQWLVRVVSNKYPAVSRGGELMYQEQGTRRWMSGVGLHDVIVEAPRHDLGLAQLEVEQLTRVLDVYRTSYLTAVSDPRVELVTLFKNHGVTAGTSLEHPHSQMIATPVVPAQVRQRVQLAVRYYDDHRTCVYCAMLAEELREDERMVAETEYFAAFVLYAALSPFHIWILPKRHHSAFPELSNAEMGDLALILRSVLRKIHKGLDDPDYNFVIRSIPGTPCQSPYFHWYLSLVPRVSTSAGFELGSGMFINTVLPEKAAAFLRSVEA
ncbi:MAG: galactose-1-phosphate uridylyltransferase [Pseudomonadota bacterium]